MLGFGGPTALEHVRPFVEGVVRGRNIPADRVDEVVRQYEVIGGKSPFNELTFEQAAQLQHLLFRNGNKGKVYVGMLYWEPYLEQTVQRMLANNVTRAATVILAPHRCEASFDRYVKRLEQAVTKVQAKQIAFNFLEPWHTEPLFIEAVSDRVQAAITQLNEGERSSMKILFVAHSIPIDMEGSSNYLNQIEETATLVADKCRVQDWQLAFQSRSGSFNEQWLSPDVKDAIRSASQASYKTVLVVPIGFVSDHVEVLYDLDVQAYQVAHQLGIKMVRAETVGSHAAFIQMLATIIKAREGVTSLR